MNNCRFDYSDGIWTCRVCGRRIKADEDTRVTAYCKVQPPTLIKQVGNYIVAVAEHLATGANVRADEEVAEILGVCENCNKYDTIHKRCLICGCKCNSKQNAFLNKLRMQSQKCPLNKW